MALVDRKIPIITGRNDVPSIDQTNPKHPNGSFITKQFNDLIDNELTKKLVFLKTNSVYPLSLYVNPTIGNDTTGNGSELNPYATIQKAIDVFCENIVIQGQIFIEGIFTNPSLDFTQYLKIIGSSVYENFETGLMIDFGAGITIGPDFNNFKTATINFNYSADVVNFDDTNAVYSNILNLNFPVVFSHINFNVNGNEPMRLVNVQKPIFNECVFDLSNRTTGSSSSIVIYNSQVDFRDCVFKTDTTINNFIFLVQSSELTLIGNIIDPLSSSVSAWMIARLTTMFLQTSLSAVDNINLSNVSSCTIYSNSADSTLFNNRWGIDPTLNILLTNSLLIP